MAENLKSIKAKISSVASLGKITRAMEMVARSKMKRAVDTAVASRAYAELALELLGRIGEAASERNIYLTENSAATKHLVVVIAGNKGLCGGYNANVFKALRSLSQGERAVEVIALGKYAARHAKKLKLTTLQIEEAAVDTPSVEGLEGVIAKVMEVYATGEYHDVTVISTNYISAFSQVVETRALLPLSEISLKSQLEETGAEGESSYEAGATGAGQIMPVYEPSAELIFNELVPRLASLQIYQALLDSVASEHSARMVAMKSATDNGAKLRDTLQLRYNRARQAGITAEILDIAAGADAVAKA